MTIKHRMERILKYISPGEKLDDTPLELAAGARIPRSAAQEIQEQIAIQVALKQKAEGMPLQTIGEIEAELLDLDEDESSPFFSQYEYIDMVDEFEPFEEAPTKEGVKNDINESEESRESDSDKEEDPGT